MDNHAQIEDITRKKKVNKELWEVTKKKIER